MSNFPNPPVIAPARYLPRSLAGCAPKSFAGAFSNDLHLLVRSFMDLTTDYIDALKRHENHAHLKPNLDALNSTWSKLKKEIVSSGNQEMISLMRGMSQDILPKVDPWVEKPNAAASEMHSQIMAIRAILVAG